MRSSNLIPLVASIPAALAAPSQPLFDNTTAIPTHFGLLLFPHFQALDVFGPMDVLNTLSMLYGNSTTMYLSIFSKTLEPVSTAMRGMHARGDFGQAIVPTITFKDYLLSRNGETEDQENDEESQDEEDDCEDGVGGHGVAKRKRQSNGHGSMGNSTEIADRGDIEVLFVPGGGGTRRNMTEEIAFVKALYPKVRIPGLPRPVHVSEPKLTYFSSNT